MTISVKSQSLFADVTKESKTSSEGWLWLLINWHIE